MYPGPGDATAKAAQESADARARHSEVTQQSTGPAHSDELHAATSAPALSDLLKSERFVPRQIIGRGGSGVVLRALDCGIRREVAIKVLAAEHVAGDIAVERFMAEARITGGLEHPNIAPVYEFGTDDAGRRFLCMKLVEGQTLEETLRSAGDGRLDPGRLADFLEVFIKVCDAVAFAHSRGVLHRDLKPANIMISDFGQVYVLDWGIARVVARAREETAGSGPGAMGDTRVDRTSGIEPLDPPGALIGTTSYMAPEQLEGRHQELDERADVFSLGATLYQILTGRPPLKPEAARAARTGAPMTPISPPEAVVPTPGIAPELSKIAMKALSFDRERRHASVSELKREIEQFLRGAWDLPRCTWPAGAIIIAEGDVGDAAYVVVEGRCSVFRVQAGSEVVLREMGPGDVFGETAAFSHKPRTASVRALTDVALLVVTGDALSKALGVNVWMAAFVEALAHRFREVDERLRAFDDLRR